MVDTQNRPKKVWMFQPRIEHYRIPVWDLLRQRAGDDYCLTVFGLLQDGHAFGGPARDYTQHLPYKEATFAGQQFSRWQGAELMIAQERPDVVIVAANPRNLSCWKLPRVAHRVGAATVCWTKVHSFSGMLPDTVMQSIKRRFFNRFDRAICYGESAKREILQLGFAEDRARVAQNTIDTKRIFEQGDQLEQRGRALRAELGLTDRKVIVCIGRMDPEKRHEDLLNAWPELKAVDPGLSLVLISGGPLLQTISERAEALDRDNIHVLGRVPEGDDYAWLAATDLAIYPGAVGLAINQSLAIGCPTIIADEPGSDAEIIVHGKTGWRFPRGNLTALVQTVQQVLQDDAERMRIIDQARTMMRESVTIDNMVACIDATIREAIGDAARQRQNQ